MNIIMAKMDKIISECDKHVLRIGHAYSKLKVIMPLTAERYESLTEDEIEHIDQFLFRFSKLQDALGEKLFLNILLFLKEENMKSKPFVDILNRLEKLDLLENKDIWLELRTIRNDVAHEYGDDPAEMANAINKICGKKEILEKIFFKIKEFYLKRR